MEKIVNIKKIGQDIWIEFPAKFRDGSYWSQRKEPKIINNNNRYRFVFKDIEDLSNEEIRMIVLQYIHDEIYRIELKIFIEPLKKLLE